MDANRAMIAQKFWDKVEISDEVECWSWSGAKKGKSGRGTLCHNGKNHIAPRVAWFIAKGDWPPRDKFVCHSCDNPNCVNPNHLWLGTNRDNILDAKRKGRLHGQSKTHCKYGHEFTPENTIRRGDWRGCRICQQEYSRDSAKRRRQTANADLRKKGKRVAGVTTRTPGKWDASISVSNKKVFLGTFASFEDAVSARKEAERKFRSLSTDRGERDDG